MAQAVKSNKAFTLIEMLVAMIIIGISIMGLMEISVVVMNNNLKNEIRNKAVETLSNHVSSITGMGYDGIQDVNGKVSCDNETIRNFKEQFTIVDNISTDSSAESKNITSTISWMYKGQSYDYTINAVVSK